MSIQQSSSWTLPLSDDQEGEQNSPHVTETVEEEEDIETTKRRKYSEVWDHFKEKNIAGKRKAVCNYCGSKLLGDPRMGTTHLHNHFNSCKVRKSMDKTSATLLKTDKRGNETLLAESYVLNQELGRQALVNMIVAHEYPLAIVDHHFFKEFCSVLQPAFKGVSRNTIKKDIMKLYNDEKENTMKLISKNRSRIAITTDMWTASNQNKGYMVVTAHFIDDAWVLQSRLLRFIYIPAPHFGKCLADVLLQCLVDWNLDRKLSTVTVDNCTANDKMIERMLSKIPHSALLLRGQLFHMRCCAHILNLVVKDGLSIISDSIEKVRASINFWTVTGKREEKFEDTCGQLNLTYNRKLVIDCPTRWNSIYLMLRVAIEYKDVFDRLSQWENQYKTAPTEDEWEMAKEVCKKLELFYDVTKLFSGTLYPTLNVLFPKICEIKMTLNGWLCSPNVVIQQMATSMSAKFDKYWGVVNGVMAIGIVLDPRYKFDFVKVMFGLIYGEKSSHEIKRIYDICQGLVEDYEKKIKGKETVNSSPCMSSIIEEQNSDGVKNWKTEWRNYLVKEGGRVKGRKTDLDIYLGERVLPNMDEQFDILGWWKQNGSKYPILLMIARDFLAIPISTVASESSFSTSGRFLTPHRSRLRPETLEALICYQNWLWSNVKGSSPSQSTDCNQIIECSTALLADSDVDIEDSCGEVGVNEVTNIIDE